MATHESPSLSHESIVVNNTTTLLHINMTNVTKLTASNFLMWSKQVHALLDGYDLAGHVDGSLVVPSPTLTTDDVVTVNPQYTLWKRQDKLIYSALLGAMTTTIQPLLSKATTANEIWEILTSTYAKPSRGHIQQLRQQIRQWTKGTKSIDDYYQGLTTRFDQLALLGKPMDVEDQIEQILVGLSDDYKTVADQIEGRDTSPSLTEIHEKLLNHEAKLLAAVPASPAPITANAAHKQYHNNNRNNNKNNYRGGHHNQQQSYTPRPYLGRCQICGVHGHSARRCSQLNLSNQSYTQSSSNTANSYSPWQPPPRANVAVAPSYNASNWILDSGATHHITADFNNLGFHWR